MRDYIIVGAGLAGIAFAEIALDEGKSVVVVSDASQNSSNIAAGLYNPVILKRFSQVWQAEEQLDLLTKFYRKLEDKLGLKLDYKLPLLRKFFSVEEQNNWFAASDKPELAKFLSTSLITTKYDSVISPFHFGEVLQSGYVDTNLLLASYKRYLIALASLYDETFDYSNLVIESDFVSYKNLKAKRIVFAEGFGIRLNPFFNNLPLDGTKGELVLIKATNLNINTIMKSSIFVIPLGNDLYKVGATYNWQDKSNMPTEQAKKELTDNLKELITCDYEIIEHYAGVRPTVKDRRPMLGSHPIYKNLFVLNGLGTRGVMLAPAMAKMLFNHIENDEELNTYVDIKRFKAFASNPYHNE
jgi:glycine oxidase